MEDQQTKSDADANACWQVMNAAPLSGRLNGNDIMAGSQALQRLVSKARAYDQQQAANSEQDETE